MVAFIFKFTINYNRIKSKNKRNNFQLVNLKTFKIDTLNKLDKLHDIISKSLFDYFIKPYLKLRLKNKSYYKYKHLNFRFQTGVFHPRYFFSTKYLLEYIGTIDMYNKSVCEVGCGSGIISIYCKTKGAKIVSFDINEKSVANPILNYKLNFKDAKSEFIIIQSDLFDKISAQTFDFIIINPPYFFKDAENVNDMAWNCGKNGNYFVKIFKQLIHYSNPSTEIIMILADNCEIEKIKAIAKLYNCDFNMVETKKIKWETNFIFKLIYKN